MLDASNPSSVWGNLNGDRRAVGHCSCLQTEEAADAKSSRDHRAWERREAESLPHVLTLFCSQEALVHFFVITRNQSIVGSAFKMHPDDHSRLPMPWSGPLSSLA